MPILDTRVPAVLLRIDRNPFHHGTLGAVRSLGRAGVEVHVVADSEGSPVRRSRFVSGMHPPPPPGSSTADIAAVLRRVAARVSRRAVLVPMDDASALAVNRLGDELTVGYLLPEQPHALAERVADKAELAAVCESVGVPHPVTLIPRSPAQAAEAAWQLGLPVVAKWSRPWLIPAGTGLRSTVVVHSVQEARALYLRTEDAGSRLLLQAFLPPGPDLDWFFHGYVARSGVTHGGGPGRKHRAWPRGAGLTAVGRWTPNPQLQALVERLTEALGYRGVFDLDFRRDAATGRYHLLDFNPRPGAQFRLFEDGAGLDVVRALHLDLTRRPLPAPAPRPGRAFVVENYAPLGALRPRSAGRELAWHARDDRAPGRAMWGLWARHVSLRLTRRVGRLLRRPAAAAETNGTTEAVGTTAEPREPTGAPGVTVPEAADAAAAVMERPVITSADPAVVRPRGGPVARKDPRSAQVPAPLTARPAGHVYRSLADDEKASSC
ncbi:ATP-grasp domain-containing protein [Streptomyces sp. NPDC002685]|uniref:carboxylate--amine ligase n=1 Tax=Streptomyces sp. NPDC002685 TaxID=3154540 RepID=UPI00332A0ED5